MNQDRQSVALPGEKSPCDFFTQLFYQDSFILDLVTVASVMEYSVLYLGALYQWRPPLPGFL